MSSFDTHVEGHGHFHLGAVAGFRVFIVASIIAASFLRLMASAYLPNWTDQLAVAILIGVVAVASVKAMEIIRR